MKCLFSAVLLTLSMMSYGQIISGGDKTGQELLVALQKGKALLIDVRTPEEYAAGHLSYSNNIDFKSERFTKLITQLPKDKAIYLYCRSGNRSGKGLDTLLQHGYTHVYNIGGLDSLKAIGLPAE